MWAGICGIMTGRERERSTLTPLIRTLVTRIANNPDGIDSSVEHFLTVIPLRILLFIFSPIVKYI
jgi:hypothetical protein